MTESVSGLSEEGGELLAPAGGGSITPEADKALTITSSNTSESLGRSVSHI